MGAGKREAAGVVACLALGAGACSRPTEAPRPAASREAGGLIHFVEDDYGQALAEARARGVLLFVDAWATWCHTCLSMRAFVFPDPAVAALADRYEWLSLDTEREDNAVVVSRLGVKVLPTLYVLDPRDERVMLAWPGSLTARELVGLLADTRSDAGPRGPLATDALVTQASREGRLADCAAMAAGEAPGMPPGTALADVVRTGIECAGEPTEGSAERQRLADLAALAERVASDPASPILADDRSDLYDRLVGALRALGRTADMARVAAGWAAFLEGEAGRAQTPAARAVFDAHRLLAYEALGAPERAVPVLQQSERDFPGDYNPPARLAAAYLSMKDYADARSAVDRALSRAYGPRKLRLWALKADVLVAAGDPGGAKAALAEALAFSRTVPLPESYPKQVEALSRRLAILESPAPDGGPSPRPPKGPGAACSGRPGECARGLACCQSAFRGHCGGVAPSAEEYARNPCVVTSSCSPAPCRPLSFPP